MNKKNNYKKYQKKFNEWMRQKLKDKDYTLQNRREISMTITEEELLSFRQCYTTDRKQKFYAARKELPKYWFISPRGTLISCYGATPHLVIPAIPGEDSKRREQYEMPKDRLIDPATLVALTFGGKATAQAEALIKTRGLKAFSHKQPRQKYVELHHIEGYRYGSTNQEIKELRAYNADIQRTILMTAIEHDMITHMPSPEEKFKNVKGMIKASQIFPHDRITMILQGEKRGTGEIFENGEKIEDRKSEAGGKTFEIQKIIGAVQMIPDVKVSLRFEDGKEVIRGKDMSKKDYDLMIRETEKEFRSGFIPYVSIMLENETKIFAVLESDGILV